MEDGWEKRRKYLPDVSFCYHTPDPAMHGFPLSTVNMKYPFPNGSGGGSGAEATAASGDGIVVTVASHSHFPPATLTMTIGFL